MALDTDNLVPRLRAPVHAFVHDDLPSPDEVQNGDAPQHRWLFNDANRTSRERVSAAMMSYWGQFAHTGAPGMGRHHEVPPRQP